MILNMTGEGNPLNFKVVGNPKPSNPSENTIWVDTDTPIAAWHFGADEPAISDGEELHVEFVNDGIYAAIDGSFVEDANYITRIYALPTGVKKICVKIENHYASNAAFGFVDSNWGSISGGPTKAGTSFFDVPSNAAYFATPVRDSETVTVTNADAKEGTVWFPTGTASNAAFNALKKNALVVCPITAYQYIGGAWVNKTAEIYQSGSWSDIAGYLYNLGDECESITGGWQARGWKANSNYSALTPTLAKNAENMTMALSKPGGDVYTASGAVEVKKNIDLTRISQIVFKFESVTVGGSATSSQKAGIVGTIVDRNATYFRTDTVAENSIYYESTGTRNDVVIAVDVSAISGEYDVVIGLMSYREGSSQSITAVLKSVELK